MSVRAITGGAPLRGEVRVPGDKSISHRAVLVAALAEGRSTLHAISKGLDVAATVAAVQAFGATVEEGVVPPSEGGRLLHVTGGRGLLHPAQQPVDCGNSGTTMRLTAGIAAGLAGRTRFVGDASLSARPMDRVKAPLELMGAQVEGQGRTCTPPIIVHGGKLAGIDYTVPVPSAQVKACVLLAALAAQGPSVVREPVVTRRHTEELLHVAGARITDTGGGVIRLEPGPLRPFELLVPGDPSQAAFWVVAGCVVPGSEVRVPGLYLRPERSAFLDVLRRMGAVIGVDDEAGDLTVRAGALHATEVPAADIPWLVDEIPVLAVAAACAEGMTRFHGLGELRVKESDRVLATMRMVKAFGAGAMERGDDLVVVGTKHLCSAIFDAAGDHRLAMAASVAALAAPGTSQVRGFESVATSYPRFGDDLDRMQRR